MAQDPAMSEKIAEAVRSALEKAPCSDRALALAADVSQPMVSRIRSGERGCSAELAGSLADALEAWAEDCRKAESEIRKAIEKEGE